MSICGFTIIRNALKYDYPVVESIRSALPLVDQMIVLVGESEDGTLDLVKSIDPKVKVFESVWDESMRQGGRVLALETDKALALVPKEYTWALYLQADEVIHQDDYTNILDACKRWETESECEGLLFSYRHFYGSYDYVATSSRWYRNEVRIIRNTGNVFSFRDAQGFRKKPNELLRVRPAHAHIHHYGWVKPPEKMQLKQYDFQRWWHEDNWIQDKYEAEGNFNYDEVDYLVKFTGSHPQSISERIRKTNWSFTRDLTKNKFSLKDRFKNLIEAWTGWKPGEYKNYKLLK